MVNVNISILYFSFFWRDYFLCVSHIFVCYRVFLFFNILLQLTNTELITHKWLRFCFLQIHRLLINKYDEKRKVMIGKCLIIMISYKQNKKKATFQDRKKSKRIKQMKFNLIVIEDE